ncbi:MAG: M24 family metallopeptidase [Myxococcota bacterium]|nr:M24 family metallopeptidase [Myxococcota bacterium]
MPIDPAVLEDFDQTQRRAIALLSDVLSELAIGLSEVDVDELIRDRARDAGFDRWFHPPEIRIGARAAQDRIRPRPSSKSRIQSGDPVVISLAPATADAFGEVGTTVVLDADEPELLGIARECTRGCVGYASHLKTVGELFVFARAWAVNHHLKLANPRSIGHRLLPKDGSLRDHDYPHTAHFATWLRRHQVHFLNPARVDGLWMMRPLLSDGSSAASFAEVVYVNGDDKRILGRDSMEDIGRF